MKLKSLLLRSVSGLVYAALIVGCILGGKESTTVLCVLLAALGMLEFTKVLGGYTAKRLPLILTDVAAVMCMALSAFLLPLAAWVLCMILRFVEELYAKDEDSVKSLAISCFGQVFVGLPCALMLANGTYFTSGYILLAIFFMLWINDTGAYLVGSLLGRHRLFERISPKKSWEGFFGGLGFNIIAAVLFSRFCPDFFGLLHGVWEWVGLALIVTIFGTWGDLVESLIKRTVHIKDSGHLIPGHGGLLDRIDSMLMAMPACFIYFLILAWARM